MSSPKKPNRKYPPASSSGNPSRQAPVKSASLPAGQNFFAILTKPSEKISSKVHYLLAGLMFVIGFLLYANTLSHEYALDDDLVYKLNKTVQKGISGIPEIFHTTNMYGFNQVNYGAYRPFTQAIFALEYQLFGLNPQMQHLASVLMFALTAFCLYLLLKRMFRAS